MTSYSTSQIVAAIDSAPAPIRTYIREGSLAMVVADIGEKRQLHVDVVGKLAELTRNMLIGLMSPVDVAQGLTASAVDEEKAKLVLNDLNDQVFKPLRDRMQASAPAAPPPVAEAPNTDESVTWIQVTPPAPQPTPAPSPSPAVPAAPPSVPAPTPSPSDVESMPHARTMAEDMALAKAGIFVEHQDEVAAEPAGTTRPLTPAPPIPKPTVSAFPPPPQPAVPQPTLPPEIKSSASTSTPPPIMKSYGIDPYREPIE